MVRGHRGSRSAGTDLGDDVACAAAGTLFLARRFRACQRGRLARPGGHSLQDRQWLGDAHCRRGRCLPRQNAGRRRWGAGRACQRDRHDRQSADGRQQDARGRSPARGAGARAGAHHHGNRRGRGGPRPYRQGRTIGLRARRRLALGFDHGAHGARPPARRRPGERDHQSGRRLGFGSGDRCGEGHRPARQIAHPGARPQQRANGSAGADGGQAQCPGRPAALPDVRKRRLFLAGAGRTQYGRGHLGARGLRQRRIGPARNHAAIAERRHAGGRHTRRARQHAAGRSASAPRCARGCGAGRTQRYRREQRHPCLRDGPRGFRFQPDSRVDQIPLGRRCDRSGRFGQGKRSRYRQGQGTGFGRRRRKGRSRRSGHRDDACL